MSIVSRLIALALLAALSSACSMSAGSTNPSAHIVGFNHASTRIPIKHIVIVIQENRSFDNIFSGFPGADAPTRGRDHLGKWIRFHSITFDDTDGGHQYANAIAQWDGGKMDGFDLTQVGSYPHSPSYNYAYLERSLVAPYWEMAKQYVLADRMFPTEFGPSFTAHLDLIAATTQLSRNRYLVDGPTLTKTGAGTGDAQPWGCDAPPGSTTRVLKPPDTTEFLGPFPCLTEFRTAADLLDSAGLSWKYYAPPLFKSGLAEIWSTFDAIKSVREGPDWKADVISPQTKILTDAAANHLPAVSWVVPDWQDSDHPGDDSTTGPSWVSSVVNAVGESHDWNSTVIVVLWDDWGGWYDDAVPPPTLDNFGLAIRVPAIIISPYAKRDHVDHTAYQFGSVVRLIEDTFELPSLGYSDANSNSLLDALDFTMAPRAFTPIVAPYSAKHFLQEKPSNKPPDDD